jgi:tetratricopeptide (TPR) repeat protein
MSHSGPKRPNGKDDTSALARLLVFAVLALTVLAPSARAQAPTDYYVTRSDRAAANLLEQVEKYHLGPGVQNTRANQYQHAHGELDFILRYFPNHPQALMLMSEVCVKWKHPGLCNPEAYFQNALQINPEAADTYTLHGIYLQNTGRLDQAIESYKKALARNPTSMNAHYNLGLAYVGKKNYAQANEHAQQAYALGMTLPGLRNMLTKAGAWKPLPEAAAPPAVGATPPAQSPPAARAAPPADSPSEGGPAAK